MSSGYSTPPRAGSHMRCGGSPARASYLGSVSATPLRASKRLRTPDLAQELSYSESEFKTLKGLGSGDFGSVRCVLCLKTGAVGALKASTESTGEKLIGDLCSISEYPRSLLRIYSTWCEDEEGSVRVQGEAATVGRLKYFVHSELLPTTVSMATFSPVHDTPSFLRDCAEALRFLWTFNFVHGDIKPDNVMRRSDGTFVLIDYGKAMSCARDSTSFSREMEATGDKRYMPPELFSTPHVLPRDRYDLVDVFSLGVSAFELHTKIPSYELRTRPEGSLVYIMSQYDGTECMRIIVSMVSHWEERIGIHSLAARCGCVEKVLVGR